MANGAPMTARAGNGGSGSPPPGVLSRVGDVRAYLQQFTQWNFRDPLGLDDYFWRTEQLMAVINSTTTSGQVTYRGPANFNGLIFEIRPHIALNAVTAETLGITGVGNLDLVNRVRMKAMNSRMNLTNTDRGAKIFNTNDLPLSTILDHPLQFHLPYVLSDGENLQLDIALVETTAAVIGGATQIGLSLVMCFVRVRP